MKTIMQAQWLNKNQDVRSAARDADRDLAKHNVADKARYAVQLVIEELMSNSIKYAFDDDQEHVLKLTLALGSEAVRITLVDHGRPFDPSCDPKTGTCRPVPSPGPGGMGIMIIRHMASSFCYRRENEQNIIEVEILNQP